MLERQGEAAGDDPVAACGSAAQSIRAAFAEPGALERTVHDPIGDKVQMVADLVVRHQFPGRRSGV
jgi:hypothetical protein